MRFREVAGYIAIGIAGAASLGTSNAYDLMSADTSETVRIPAGGEVQTAPFAVRSDASIDAIKLRFDAPIEGLSVTLVNLDTGERSGVALARQDQPTLLCEENFEPDTKTLSSCPGRFQLVFANGSTSELVVSFSLEVTVMRGLGSPGWYAKSAASLPLHIHYWSAKRRVS